MALTGYQISDERKAKIYNVLYNKTVTQLNDSSNTIVNLLDDSSYKTQDEVDYINKKINNFRTSGNILKNIANSYGIDIDYSDLNNAYDNYSSITKKRNDVYRLYSNADDFNKAMEESKKYDYYYNYDDTAANNRIAQIDAYIVELKKQHAQMPDLGLSATASDEGPLLEEKEKIKQDLTMAKTVRWYRKAYEAIKDYDDEEEALMKSYATANWNYTHYTSNADLSDVYLSQMQEVRSALIAKTGWDSDTFEYKAQQYVDVFNSQTNGQNMSNVKQYVKDNGLLGGIVGTGLSYITKLFSGAGIYDAYAQQMKNKNFGWDDRPISTDTAGFQASNLTDAYRGAASESMQNFGENVGKFIADNSNTDKKTKTAIIENSGKMFKGAYDYGTSFGDNIINLGVAAGTAYVTGGGDLIRGLAMDFIVGSQVATNEFKNMKANGYSDDAALLGSTLKGGVEGLTESFSMEYILKQIEGGGFYNKILKPFLAEGSEEVNGNILDRTIDSVLGNKYISPSMFETVYNKEIAEGKSKADAFFSAWWNSALKEDINTFWQAGTQGILLGKSADIVNTMQTGLQIKENGELQDYIDAGMKLPKGSTGYDLASKMQDITQKGKNITSFSAGKLVNEITSGIKSQATQSLQSLGEKGNIDILSDAITKKTLSQELTQTEKLALQNSTNAQAVLQEMSGKLSGGQNIDSVKTNGVNVQNKSQSRLSESESYVLGVTDEEIQNLKDNGDSMYAKYVEGLRDNARIEDGKQIERDAILKQYPLEKLQELAKNGDYDTISFVNAKLKALDKMTDYSVDNSFYKSLSIENSKRNAASQNNNTVIAAMPQYAKTRVGADSASNSIGAGNQGISQPGIITTSGSSKSSGGGSVTTPISEAVSPSDTTSNNAGVDGKNSGEYNEGENKVNDFMEKTGIGSTGEGIPIEKVNSKVLDEIYPNSSGAYGYLPKEGSTYSNIDFTDVDKARTNRAIRKEYLRQTEVIENTINKMKSQGASSEEIASIIVDMRNKDKIYSRSSMSPNDVAELEARNIKKYGNPIGPDADALFKSNKTKLQKTNPHVTDQEVWDSVIEGAMRKDEVINTLLGLEYNK